MPEEFVIRQAVNGDALLIAALATVTFYEAYFEQDDPHDLAVYLTETFSPDSVRDQLNDPDHRFYILFRNTRAVGYAKLRDAEPHPSVRSRDAVELQRFYLVERVWGTGAGRRLLDHCFKAVAEMGKDAIWLGVWEENKRGLAFYTKHGFERVGTLEYPYGDSVGINAVMQRSLR